MKEFEQVIRIRPQEDAFDDVRMEYAKMLKQQLAKGNNGLVKSKYITFSIEADNIREAKPKLERIESDILNNFKILGVPAYPLNGVERLQILYETCIGLSLSSSFINISGEKNSPSNISDNEYKLLRNTSSLFK